MASSNKKGTWENLEYLRQIVLGLLMTFAFSVIKYLKAIIAIFIPLN